MVEHLGSGLPRITEFYGPECFRFTDNFLRITFAASRPVHEDEATEQVEAPVEAPVKAPVILSETDKKILAALAPEPLGRSALLAALGYTQPTGNYKVAMGKLLQTGLIEYTITGKPNSRLQQYRLTAQGKALLK
jgi:ATP-dependent DNA helicase RecG